LEFQNAGIQLSAFLWKSDNQPYQLPVTITPPNNWDSEQFISKYNLILNDLLTTAGENHPNLTLYNYKLGILEIEKKLKFQDVLPKVDFRYNFLAKGFEMQNTIGANSVFQNNYQYGIKLEVPLFLSQGRANYKTAKLKLADTRLDQIQKQLQVQLKIKSYFNTYLTYKNQVALQRKNYENYQKLVKAEEVKFFNGESSLFLINSRENKALEGLEKLIETKANYLKSVYAIQWSAGLLK
jgi:outer membrane protein TolC